MPYPRENVQSKTSMPAENKEAKAESGTAQENERITCLSVAWSYGGKGTVKEGKLEVTDGTTTFTFYVGSGFGEWNMNGWQSAPGAKVTAKLAAGGSEVSGSVTLTYFV